MRKNKIFNTMLLAIAFTNSINASALDKHFIKKDGIFGPDWDNGYTLQDFQTPELSENALTTTFDAPEVDTYDVDNGYGTQVKFVANIRLAGHAKALLQKILGQTIPDDRYFQFIVQKSSTLNVARPTPGGGIKKGQKEPISLKAQYPYAKYATQNWYGSQGGATYYSVAGAVTVDSALLEDQTSLIYPQRRTVLSVHSIGDKQHSTVLSGDILHLYRGGANPPATLDTPEFYSDADYARLIKGENKTKALFYKIQYSGWKRVLTKPDLINKGKTITLDSKDLKNEEDRWGMVLLLSDADYGEFEKNLDHGTLRTALQKVDLFNKPLYGIQDGLRLRDMFEYVKPFNFGSRITLLDHRFEQSKKYAEDAQRQYDLNKQNYYKKVEVAKKKQEELKKQQAEAAKKKQEELKKQQLEAAKKQQDAKAKK